MQNCNCNIKKNMGLADRIIRTTASAVLIELVTCKKVSKSVRVGLLLVAGVFLATSLMGSCPVYTALGVSTKSNGGDADEDIPTRVF
ncbi:MAG: DUF2892 domain-containing protein [Ginsengibacter sp.]